MFAFMKKGIYRRQFIIYTIALFLACLVVCVVLLKTTVSTQVNRAQQEALSYFQASENAVTSNKQQIDSYFMQLYSPENAAIMADLQRFLGNNAEGYVMARLNDLSVSAVNYSFIQHLRNFIENNHYAVPRVACFSINSDIRGNEIILPPDGRCSISFQSADYPVLDDDFSQGIRYTKFIPHPDNSSVLLGNMIFTISQNAVFPKPSASMIGDVAVIGKSSELFITAGDESTKETLRTISEGASNHGTWGKSLLYPSYYTVYTSENNRYKLVSLVRFRDILKSSPTMVFGPIIGMFFIFAFITILLAVRMSYDAQRLGLITGAIDSAKAGKFTKIALGHKDDEYSIIADELNTMSDELNSYIEKEYALKLRQKEAEMKVLQQQIHPHFLYNTLEVIRSRALLNQDSDVADAVYNLGSMFRAMVKTEDVISVEDEIGILKKYLQLMEFKYIGNFFYQIDVAAELRSLSTVKFWLQPLAENFFLHGFDQENPLNLILLRGYLEEETVCFDLINNGHKMSGEALDAVNASLSKNTPQSTKSIGLQNVYLRLCYFYGDTVEMHLKNNEESGITISIRFARKEPKKTGGA